MLFLNTPVLFVTFLIKFQLINAKYGFLPLRNIRKIVDTKADINLCKAETNFLNLKSAEPVNNQKYFIYFITQVKNLIYV